MKEKATKRIENKKKKMAALLQITKLNEYDRQHRKTYREVQQDPNISNSSELESCAKRPRTEPPAEEPSAVLPPLIGDQQLGPSGKPKLSGDEFLELKRMLREKTTKITQHPRFRLREMGDNATLSKSAENRTPLFLSDIQHLIMYSQLGHHSSYSPARWCALEKYNRLVNTNVLVVENLDLLSYSSHESCFPFISSTFEHKLELLSSSNTDVIKDLSMIPLTGTQMKKFINEFGDLNTAVLRSAEVFDTVRNLFPIENPREAIPVPSNVNLPHSDKYPRTQLLLSGWQMVEENYPLPIKGLMDTKYAGYVMTKDEYTYVTPTSKMFGLDCEMCMTTSADVELTRISLVDEDHNVFYDTLVKPDNKITDYLTRFSGITAKMMRNVTTKLADVQTDLRRLLPSDAILVGQSLGNDLHAMKMMHPYVIDSGVVYNLTGDRTRKTKLKTLARQFLSENIQQGRAGHCSTEDSIAALKLIQLKLTKSLYFGDAVMGNIHDEIRMYPELGTFNYATSLLRQSTKLNRTASVVGLDDIGLKYRDFIDKGANSVEIDSTKIRCISEKSTKDVIKKQCELMKDFSLNIGHIKINQGELEGTKVFKNIDKWVRDLYEATKAPGLLIVIFTGSDNSNGVCFVQMKTRL